MTTMGQGDNKRSFLGDFVTVVCLVSFLTSISGCAAMMAAKQPEYTDLSVLRQGASRSEIVSAFGRPMTTDKDENGNLVETYQFKQGYTTGTKAVRVVFHIVADVLTIFLWELIGMPMEMVFDGNKVDVDATYNAEKKLQESTVIKKQ